MTGEPRTDGTPRPEPGAADQGARGGNEPPGQVTGAMLQKMTPEEIVAAQNRGQLDALLRGDLD